MAHAHHHRNPPAYDETGVSDFDPVVEAALSSDMETVALEVKPGDIYRAEQLDLRPYELTALRPLLRKRDLGMLLEDGCWFILAASEIRTCDTCAEEVLREEQCERCIGPVGVAS